MSTQWESSVKFESLKLQANRITPQVIEVALQKLSAQRKRYDAKTGKMVYVRLTGRIGMSAVTTRDYTQERNEWNNTYYVSAVNKLEYLERRYKQEIKGNHLSKATRIASLIETMKTRMDGIMCAIENNTRYKTPKCTKKTVSEVPASKPSNLQIDASKQEERTKLLNTLV